MVVMVGDGDGGDGGDGSGDGGIGGGGGGDGGGGSGGDRGDGVDGDNGGGSGDGGKGGDGGDGGDGGSGSGDGGSGGVFLLTVLSSSQIQLLEWAIPRNSTDSKQLTCQVEDLRCLGSLSGLNHQRGGSVGPSHRKWTGPHVLSLHCNCMLADQLA